MVIITNCIYKDGVWMDSEPMKWTPEVQATFDKMLRNFMIGLTNRRPVMIWLEEEK